MKKSMKITVDLLVRAFSVWETASRMDPPSFMSGKDCEDADLNDVSVARASYMLELLGYQLAEMKKAGKPKAVKAKCAETTKDSIKDPQPKAKKAKKGNRK